MLYEQFHKPLASAERFAHETLIDGELLALGPDGKPSFNLLQNLRSAESHVIYYYAFDILFLHRGPCSARITSPGRRSHEHLSRNDVRPPPLGRLGKGSFTAAPVAPASRPRTAIR
jgi:hypothetical protein